MRGCDIGRHDADTELRRRLGPGTKDARWDSEVLDLGKPCPRPAVGFLAGIHACVVHRRRLIAKGAEWVVHAEVEWARCNGHEAAA